jgi:hypothetical protein
LLSGKESAAYADSAYLSLAHNDWMAKRGFENRVIKEAYRNKPLTAKDKQFNRLHVGVCFGLMCIAHNIKGGILFSRRVTLNAFKLEKEVSTFLLN